MKTMKMTMISKLKITIIVSFSFTVSYLPSSLSERNTSLNSSSETNDVKQKFHRRVAAAAAIVGKCCC